jgi:hypothetical protein
MIKKMLYDDYDRLLQQFKKLETCKELDSSEITSLGYEFKKGKIWEIRTELTVNTIVKDVIFYLNFPFDFPYVLPKLFIEKTFYDSVKYIPHVNSDFSICIFDSALNPYLSKKHLNRLLEPLLNEGKKIIEKGIHDEHYCLEEFNREFKAYWELNYAENDTCKLYGLYSIEEDLNTPQIIKGIKFDIGFQSEYLYFVSDNDKDYSLFKEYIETYNVSYSEIKVFYINKVFENPPYNKTFKEILELLRPQKEIYQDFKNVANKSKWNDILVLFGSIYNSNKNYYGWTYPQPTIPNKGGWSVKSIINWMDSPIVGGRNNILRMSLDNISLKRLQTRTTGYEESQKSIVLTGVGSVGSNLTFYLKNLPINRFHFIDEERLTIENINRHLLGFVDVNYSKSSRMAKYIKDFSPLVNAEYKHSSISKILADEPSFIDDCDFHVVALGSSSIEELILLNVLQKKINNTTIFYWVEPYLASGQILIVKPEDAQLAIDLINEFPYHVLSDGQTDKTYLIEGGCQTGYFPYSSAYLTQFLSSTFQELKDTIFHSKDNSRVISWIGDKSLLADKELTLTDFGNRYESYTVITNNLE